MIRIREEYPLIKKSRFNRFKTQMRRSLIISKKDFKIYYNKPPVLIQGVLFPVILFFAFTIGRNISPLYLISGLMAMVLFLTTTSIGPVIFPWETRQKTLERLITCPLSIKTILIGSLWSSFLFGMIFSSIPLILGFFFLSLPISINLILLIGGIIISALSFASFSLILSVPPTTTPANTMILTVLIKFPLLFISPLFMPIATFPIAIISPLTYFIDIINVGLGDISAFGTFGLLIDFGVMLVFGIGFLFLATTLHQKTLEKRFQG